MCRVSSLVSSLAKVIWNALQRLQIGLRHSRTKKKCCIEQDTESRQMQSEYGKEEKASTLKKAEK